MVYIVTNREVFEGKEGFDQFGKKPSKKEETGSSASNAKELERLGDKPNPKGNLELRIVEVTSTDDGWNVHILPDEPTDDLLERAGLVRPNDPENKLYASDYVAAMLRNRQARGESPRDILLFVHGFNNNIEDVVKRAFWLGETYDVEVIAFSWPANGGGITGVPSYKSDKRDALASGGALDRCIEKIDGLLRAVNEDQYKAIRDKAYRLFKDDAERRENYIARAMEDVCPVRISMMLHSMGNYLLKHLLPSSTYCAHNLVFDNVILAAADTNNKDHAAWVDRIQCRNRIYITINEDDSALRASRMKLGSQQLARLGHFTKGLDSTFGTYVDFTAADKVGSSHAYFEGEPLENEAVKNFFDAAVHGKRAEEGLVFDASRNLYRTRG